jgi:hypothetical protein
MARRIPISGVRWLATCAITQPGCTGAARNGTSIPKFRGRIRSERLKDWGESKEQPASNPNDEREAEDARVHREVNRLRNHEGVEQRRAYTSDEQRADRAQDPKEHRFGEPLTDKPYTAGADLLEPIRPSRLREVGRRTLSVRHR